MVLMLILALIRMKKYIDIRTRAVVFNEEDEILVEHGLTPETNSYNLLGGGVKFREKLEDCLVRELKEETGLNIEINRLLWVRDFLDQFPGHSVEVFFLASIVGGRFNATNKVEPIEFSFKTIEELEKIRFYPRDFIPQLKLLRDNRNWHEEKHYIRSAN